MLELYFGILALFRFCSELAMLGLYCQEIRLKFVGEALTLG